MIPQEDGQDTPTFLMLQDMARMLFEEFLKLEKQPNVIRNSK